MKHKIIFYPGLGEKPSNYKAFSKLVTVADIDWNTGKYIPKVTNADIVISFSLGINYALDYASKHKVKKLILCSPAPFETLKGIKVPEIILMAGEKEKFLIENNLRLWKNWHNKKSIKLVTIPKIGHKITPKYLKVIIKYF